MTDETRLTVFFDGACPLCRREVATYRRLDAAGRIAWCDVAESGPALTALGISPQAALARIHARQPDGSLITGAAVFVAMWRRLPYLRWIAPVAGTRPVLAVLDRAYVWFARRRGRLTGRGACAAGSGGPDTTRCSRP